MSYRELRNVVFEEVKSLIDTMLNELRNAEVEERGVDITSYAQASATVFTRLNVRFDEAQSRGEKNSKKFFN